MRVAISVPPAQFLAPMTSGKVTDLGVSGRVIKTSFS